MSEKDPQRPMEMLFHGEKGDKGEPGAKGDTGARGLTARTVRAIVSLFLIAFVVAGASLVLSSREVSANNQKWCTVMDLLTQHAVPYPADPAKNPSRLQAYIIYSDFRQLRTQLGCG